MCRDPHDILGTHLAVPDFIPQPMANTSDLSSLLREASACCAARLSSHGTVPEDVHLSEVVRALDTSDPWLGYRHIPDPVRQLWLRLESLVGPQGLSDHLRLLLLRFIEEFGARFAAADLPACFVGEFQGAFRRIARECVNATLDASPSCDNFMKDLGIVRLRLVPAVSHLLYLHSGVPRRTLLRHPSLLPIIWRLGGVRPLVENHVHPLMLDRFDETGRERCYQLIGHLLRARPELRGLMGASWYYDPSLGRISPKLAYLHDVPVRNGAIVLRMEPEGQESGALARSMRRRALYDTGRYAPHTYLMLWSRGDFLSYVSTQN